MPSMSWDGSASASPSDCASAERLRKRHAVALHAAQDVVARAVQDARDARERVAGQAVFDRADDRHAARDRRLEPHVTAGPPRGLEQLGAGVRDDLFVGGDDRLSRRERAPDPLFRRRPSADELHEHVDIVGQRVVDVLGPADRGVEPVHTLALDVAIADDHHLQLRRPQIVQEARDRAADRAEPGDGDAAGTPRDRAMFARAHGCTARSG